MVPYFADHSFAHSERFRRKRRDWNDRSLLMSWREQWARIANEHLQRAGRDIRIDHRTLEAQGISLIPGVKVGLSADRREQTALPRSVAERIGQQRAISAENGRRILEYPAIALLALTHHQATFTHAGVAKYVHGRTDGLVQFQAAYLKVTTSPELVKL